MRVIHTGKTAEECVDDIAPFFCIVKLPVHPGQNHIPVRIRKGERADSVRHRLRFRVSFKMIVINPLDQGPPVFHPERIGQPVIEQQVQIRACFRIFVFGLNRFRILEQIACSGLRPVDTDRVTVCLVVGSPQIVFIAGRIRAVMIVRGDHPADTERRGILFIDSAA